MYRNNRTTLLILAIILPFSVLRSGQPETQQIQIEEATKVEYEQEKQSSRKKIIKWGGIATGIAAAIAAAAGIYFNRSKKTNVPVASQEDIENNKILSSIRNATTRKQIIELAQEYKGNKKLLRKAQNIRLAELMTDFYQQNDKDNAREKIKAHLLDTVRAKLSIQDLSFFYKEVWPQVNRTLFQEALKNPELKTLIENFILITEDI